MSPGTCRRVDLGPLGFVEQEFFFSGATSVGPYTSRMIVRRPEDPQRFNGTVIVEWFNASAGFDIDVDYLSLLPLMQREGYAYVGVTAQQVPVNFLKNRNPARYGSLNMAEVQPAQPAAFEVFSQAGMALRHNGLGEDPLGGLHAERLIAIGQSQSSSRLTTYVNTIHNVTVAPVYDGFIPHAGGGAPTSFPAPIIKLNSENEAPGYFGSRAVSSPNYRYWEVPGSSHQPLDSNEAEHDLLSLGLGAPFPDCPFPYEGPGGPAGIDPVLRSAVVHLDEWIQIRARAASRTVDRHGAQRHQPERRRDPTRPVRKRPRRDPPAPAGSPNRPEHPVDRLLHPLFPQWDAFDGGADPAVDPADAVNATEPASAKAVYGDHLNYALRFIVRGQAGRERRIHPAGGFVEADGRRRCSPTSPTSRTESVAASPRRGNRVYGDRRQLPPSRRGRRRQRLESALPVGAVEGLDPRRIVKVIRRARTVNPAVGEVPKEHVDKGLGVEVVEVFVVDTCGFGVGEGDSPPEEGDAHLRRRVTHPFLALVDDEPCAPLEVHRRARTVTRNVAIPLRVAERSDPVEHVVVVADERDVSERAVDDGRWPGRTVCPVLVAAVFAGIEPCERGGNPHRPAVEEARRAHDGEQPCRRRERSAERRGVEMRTAVLLRCHDVHGDRSGPHDLRGEHCAAQPRESAGCR